MSDDLWPYLRKAHHGAAWLSLLSAMSMFLADYEIKGYPGAVGYNGGPMPPVSVYQWRLLSLVITGILGLVSLPRWQSIIALASIGFFYYLQSRT